MALVSRARGTFYGQRTGGAPHRRAVFIGFGPLAGGAAGARERSLKSSHFVAPLFEYMIIHSGKSAGRTIFRGRYPGKEWHMWPYRSARRKDSAEPVRAATGANRKPCDTLDGYEETWNSRIHLRGVRCHQLDEYGAQWALRNSSPRGRGSVDWHRHVFRRGACRSRHHTAQTPVRQEVGLCPTNRSQVASSRRNREHRTTAAPASATAWSCSPEPPLAPIAPTTFPFSLRGIPPAKIMIRP